MADKLNEKTLGNSDISGAKVNVPDIVVFGNGDAWQLMGKASTKLQGWMKSTKAMEVPGGCFLQVSTQQKNPDGSYVIAEGVTFAPGLRIIEEHDGDDKDVVTGRKFAKEN